MTFISINYNPNLPEWFQRRYPIGQCLEASFSPKPPLTIAAEVVQHTDSSALLRVDQLSGQPDDNLIANHLLSQINDEGILTIQPSDLIMMLSIFKPVGRRVLSLRERFPQYYPVTDSSTIAIADRIAVDIGCKPDSVIRALRGFTGADRVLEALLIHQSEKTGKKVSSLAEAAELMADHDANLKDLPYVCINRDSPINGEES